MIHAVLFDADRHEQSHHHPEDPEQQQAERDDREPGGSSTARSAQACPGFEVGVHRAYDSAALTSLLQPFAGFSDPQISCRRLS